MLRKRRGRAMAGLNLTAFLLRLLLFSIVLRQAVAGGRRATETGTVADIDGALRRSPEHRGYTVTKAGAGARETRKTKGRRLGVDCGSREEGKLKVECELRERRRHSGVNFVDFVPFSSDYRGAKTHPPKNN